MLASTGMTSRWGDPAEPSPFPLNEQVVERIVAHLSTLKDSVGLTQAICKRFNVTRKQLVESGFATNHRVVAPPGFDEPQVDYKDLYEELPQQKIVEIIEYLTTAEEERFIEVGDINSWFEVRTPQLEVAGFVFSEKNAHGAMNVAIPGGEPPSMPLTGKEMLAKGISSKGKGKGRQGREKGKGKDSGKTWSDGSPFGSSDGWSGSDDWSQGNPMMQQQMMMMQMMQMTMMMKGKMKGMKGKMMAMKGKGKDGKGEMGIEEDMGDGGGKGKGKFKGGGKGKKGNGANPFDAPLDEERKHELMTMLLDDVDTSAPLAAIASRFKVGKRQLEDAGFVIGPPNDSGQVSVAPPGFLPPEPPAKVQKITLDFSTNETWA